MAKKQIARQTARVNTPLLFLLLVLIPLYGGYYNFSVLLAGAILVPLLLYTCLRQGTLTLPVSAPAWFLYGLWACYLVTIPFAVSVGMAMTGWLRVTVWVLFFLYAATYSPEERRSILDAVAYEGAILSLLATVSFLYGAANGVVDANGRIDGPFQYANTWALYQLVCLILLMGKPRRRLDWAAMAVLLCGICLSGSRGTFLLVLLLGAGYGLWLLRARRAKIVALGAASALGVGGVAVLLSGGMVWERLKAITLTSSSLNGRLLYALDGLEMILAHPLGLGRGGYLYTQPLEQRGVYVLRFIHNEYLQASLDAGLLAGLLLGALVILLLLRREMPARERLVILAVSVHAAIDFDFQFSAAVFLLLLCGTGGKTFAVTVKKGLPVKAVCGLLTLLLTYGTLVYGLDFLGCTDAAYRLYPLDLELAERRLQSFSTVEEAQPVADRIIKTTDLSMLAWDCKFAAATQRADVGEMVRMKYQYLRLNRYRGEVYEDFTQLLENACAQASAEDLLLYQSMAQAIITQLEEVNRTTRDLAYRIADRPALEFSEEILQRLSQITQKGSLIP